MRKIYQSQITKIDRSPSGNVIFLYIRMEDPLAEFYREAWQFVVINCKVWDQLVRRSYSIATTLNDYYKTGEVGFLVKQVPWWSMTTQLVQNSKVWDLLEIVWPVGRMTCIPKYWEDYLLISSGSGLWPIRSIYNTAKSSWRYNKIVQIFWERSLDEIPDLQDIIEQSKITDHEKYIKNILTLSRQRIDWYRQGYVQDWIEEELSDLNIEKLNIYICGKPAMVDESIIVLNNLWIDNSKIHFEKY